MNQENLEKNELLLLNLFQKATIINHIPKIVLPHLLQEICSNII